MVHFREYGTSSQAQHVAEVHPFHCVAMYPGIQPVPPFRVVAMKEKPGDNYSLHPMAHSKTQKPPPPAPKTTGTPDKANKAPSTGGMVKLKPTKAG